VSARINHRTCRRASTTEYKNGTVTRRRPAKERARFQADFAATTKKCQCQCVLKSKPSLELVFVLLDFPHEFYRKQQKQVLKKAANFRCWRQNFKVVAQRTQTPHPKRREIPLHLRTPGARRF
jgi:hypothetical protein